MEGNNIDLVNENLAKINITLMKLVKLLENKSKMEEDHLQCIRNEQEQLTETLIYRLKQVESRVDRY